MSETLRHSLTERSRGLRKVNKSKALLLAAVALPFGASAANAQEVLWGTEFTPDHAALEANKLSPADAFTLPSSPITPDPRLSMLKPGMAADDNHMARVKAMKAMMSAQQQQFGLRSFSAAASTNGALASSGPSISAAVEPFVAEYTEKESEEGSNDSPETAERVRGLKTGVTSKNTALVTGSLGQELVIRELVQAEDDGAIPLALQSGVTGGPDGITFSGTIGDGPNPGVTSDYDFVQVSLPANTTFEVSVETDEPFEDLDPFVSFYLLDGTLIFQQDDGGDGFDTFVQLTVGDADLEFVMAIGGFGAFEPADPFDSSSGSITGAIGSEGDYQFTLRAFPTGTGATDVYKFRMNKGDVLGVAARVDGSPTLEIFNAAGEFEKGVTGIGTFAVPESPLPIDGTGVIDYVAEASGMYSIALSGGFGAYEMDIALRRPGLQIQRDSVQLIWLDYNGGPVDKAPWFGFPFVTDHTPFRDFLPAWGLPNSDDDIRRITSAVTAGVRDNLLTDLKESGINKRIDVVVAGNDGTGVTSMLENLVDQGSFEINGVTYEVSVVEISGTISESFISTIGIASTIDPGNYALNDAALVLLDIISAPASGGDANGSFSLNDVVLAPGITKEEMVAEVVANITAHEAGHYLGNFHTDGVFSTNQNTMDEGPGGLFNLAGIGPSGIFGADDATDVAFIDDTYSVLEGFQGDENTTVNTAFALTTTVSNRDKDDLPSD
ncbi:MAG: hypothetical protein AAFO81_00875 [Pseudomonadota bacterium]